MPRHQGYYSLVQFCPDPARAEVANVGVLLFSPSDNFLKPKLSKSIQRVRTVFPQLDYDVHQIRSMIEWLDNRLAVERDRVRTKDDLRHFINTRFNDIRLTDPKPVMVEQPDEALASLYTKLVALPRQVEEKQKLPKIPFPRVDRFFHEPDFHGLVQFGKKVTIPVWDRQIQMPYIFSNGIVHNVKPQYFASVDAAANLVVEGRLLAKHAQANGKRQELFILPKVKPKKQDIRDNVLGVLREMQGDGVTVVLEYEIPQFLDDLRAKL